MKKFIYIIGFLIFTINSNAQVTGTSLLLDGIDNYITVPDISSLDFSDSLSIELWVNLAETVNHTFISKGWCNNQDYAYYFEVTNGQLAFMWNSTGSCGSGNNIYRSDSVVMFPYTCTHIAFVLGTTGAKFYVNGSLVPGSLITGSYTSIYNSSESLRIGSYIAINGNLSSFVNGEIDELRIWDYPLTSTDINSRMNTPLNGNEQGLVAYYDMEESGAGSGFTLINKCVSTGSSLNGTSSGSNVTPSHIPVCTLVGYSQLTDIASTISVFPNPFTNNITISSEKMYPDFSIEVVNILNEVIFKQNYSDFYSVSVDLSNFAEGAYFIKLKTEGTIAVKKIIRL